VGKLNSKQATPVSGKPQSSIRDKMQLIVFLFAVAAGADPTVTLNNGIKMPLVALGTWQYNDSTAEHAIKLALPLGFTHIDTAESYKNQVGVGKALVGVDRKSYFVSCVLSTSFGQYYSTNTLL
jgi:hypothetical protein